MNPAITTPQSTGSMSLLTRLSRVVYRRATEDVIGMRLKQLIALDHLRSHNSCLQQALGQTLMLDANNCVILLNELDGLGYVERKRDPADRRRHIVAITAKGVKALAKAEVELETLEGEVLGNLAAGERDHLHELLAKAMDGQEAVLDGTETC